METRKNMTGLLDVEGFVFGRWTILSSGACGIEHAERRAAAIANRQGIAVRIVTMQTGERVDENGWTALGSRLRQIAALMNQTSPTPMDVG